MLINPELGHFFHVRPTDRIHKQLMVNPTDDCIPFLLVSSNKGETLSEKNMLMALVSLNG